MPLILILAAFMEGGYTPQAFYAGTTAEWYQDSRYPNFLADHLAEAQRILCPGLEVTPEQWRIWESETYFLRSLLEEAELIGSQWVALEAVVNAERERIDVILCGKGEDGNQHVAVMEVKDWHTSRRKDRRYTVRLAYPNDRQSTDIRVQLHQNAGRFTDTEVWYPEQIHENPLLKLQKTYVLPVRRQLREVLQSDQIPTVTGCLVLPKCPKLSQQSRQALLSRLPPDFTRNYPVFTKNGCDASGSLSQLADRLGMKLGEGEGEEVWKILSRALYSVDLPREESDAVEIPPEEPVHVPEVHTAASDLLSPVYLVQTEPIPPIHPEPPEYQRDTAPPESFWQRVWRVFGKR